MEIFRHIVVLSIISRCAAVSLREQLEHVLRRRLESEKYDLLSRRLLENQDGDLIERRFYAPAASVLGVPSRPSHLPAAEPILPGHTLLRPALGMLKSAVKYPHRELENGAGVYGNVDNLGLRYDGVNERILYTGFRRFPTDYIMVLPQKSNTNKKSLVFIGAPITVDSEHFTPDPQSLKEILENRVETERAINNFFKKTKIDRKSNLGNKQFRDDTPNNALRGGYNGAHKDGPPKRLNMPYDSSSSSAEHLRPTGESEDEAEKTDYEDKKTWFAKSKNAYNHVKISSHAPDIADYMPVDQDDFDELRNWWFFNQDDFKVFKDLGSEEEDNTPERHNDHDHINK